MTRFFQWLLSGWRARQRRIDIEILWPACKQAGKGDVDLAQAIFMTHAIRDSAWKCLGVDEIIRIIEELK